MNKLKIQIESKLENIKIARNLISIIASEYNPTITFINELKTIISEAVTNCIVHGYDMDNTKLIDIDISYDEIGLEVSILDKGKGIVDIEQAKVPMFTTKEETNRSGLGFTIMEVFSDDFLVSSEIDKYTLVKFSKIWDNIEE